VTAFIFFNEPPLGLLDGLRNHEDSGKSASRLGISPKVTVKKDISPAYHEL
jgi:hypothetical protein